MRSTEGELAAAQEGDDQARERLIRRHATYIRQVASQTAKRSVQETDEEWSIALIAFNEAIDAYCPERAASFRTFARTVISRRLVDLFRRRRRRREVPMSAVEVENDEGDRFNPAVAEEAERQRLLSEAARQRSYEVEEFRSLLTEYGVALDDLVDEAPRQHGARVRARQVAELLIADDSALCYFREHKRLPLKGLSQHPDVPVSRSTMERHRSYIVALALLLMEDLPHLRSCLPEARTSDEVSAL